MWLLHVVLIGSFKNAFLSLVRMIESQFHRDVHRVLKLFNALLHRAKIAGEVGSRFLFDERENNSQLIEKIVYCMEYWV